MILRDVAPLATRTALLPVLSEVKDPNLLGLVFQATWPDSITST